MTTGRRLHHTYADYLAVEQDSPVRHEYFDGEIFAMASRTPEHAALAAQVIALLQQRLPAGCRVFSSDLKVRIEATGLTTYPDVTVVCGPLGRAPEDAHAVTNPTLLVEVTSPSTEDYDRGEKLEHYRRLDSLCAVLVVSHRAHEITVVSRGGSQWTTRIAGPGARALLERPAISLGVDEVYGALAGL